MGSSSGISYLWIMAIMVVIVGPAALVSVIAISLRGTKPAERPEILKALAILLRAARPGKERRSPR
jgi:hypothetical protein